DRHPACLHICLFQAKVRARQDACPTKELDHTVFRWHEVIVNLQAAQKAAIDAAKAAGALMRKNLNAEKKANEITAHDIKLELDVRCQKLIEKKLHAAFPQIALLGEEGDSGDESAEYRWV